MKKVILAIAIVISISATANAQTSSANEQQKSSSKMKMKDGVMMMDSKMMLCKDNKCTSLTETYTCTDGCKVSTDGTVTKPDGSTMKLMNGYAVDKKGKVAMIPHGQPGHVCSDTCPMHGKM